MRYFDISAMEVKDKGLVSMLGYKKIFNKDELPVTENHNYTENCIFKSGTSGELSRAMKRNNVIGIIIKDNEMIRAIFEEAKEHEKLIILPTHDLTCVDTRQRLRNLYRMRSILAFATRSKVKTAIATLAEDESCLLSSTQMIEIAKYLGAEEEEAKRMLSRIGDKV